MGKNESLEERRRHAGRAREVTPMEAARSRAIVEAAMRRFAAEDPGSTFDDRK